MAALHDLCQNPLFSRQTICKQYIVLNHVFFRYESNLEIWTHYICYGKSEAKIFSMVIKVKLLASKASNSYFNSMFSFKCS